MAGVVAYASSSEDEDDEEEKKNLVHVAAPQEASKPSSSSTSTSTGTSSKDIRDGANASLKPEISGTTTATETETAKEETSTTKKEQQKGMKKKKKKKKKKKTTQSPPGGLPLIEAPVDLNSDSEDDALSEGKADDGGSGRKSATLGQLSSLWGDAVDDDLGDVEVGVASGPQDMPGFSVDSRYSQDATIVNDGVAAAATAAAADDDDDDNGGFTNARHSDRKIRKLLESGADLAGVAVPFTEISEAGVKAHAKSLKEEREGERALDPVHATAVAGASIDKRNVNMTMKRKHQLVSIALNAQQNEGDLEKMWSQEKKARASAGKKYGF
ncbi:Hypothetical Protein FCC1311_077272 [Hondaea fermentalgiana]|uniref:Proline-rich protein PRCC n=1 Tax=Hondaea fermentalgiana TaxID=2315210 RepID=A0A2R5GS81_9STRA|nr:Hypothetical Protein FCC1311_077272 [Hondaea fermentalgiana]|eukprot:GBG31503.1 Hypothetical Protein FCC1311_077272 [Hondaea fermentalgiana]